MTAQGHADDAGRMLGWGGLAVAGAVAIILLDGNRAIAVGILLPLLATSAVALLPALRGNPAIWLVTALWTGVVGVISIFSVGIIFLIATVFLLAAFVRAN